MAEFCSHCHEKYFDINLVQIALSLKRGHSEDFLCEGCTRRCVYKDEEGRVYIGYEVEGKLDLKQTKIENI